MIRIILIGLCTAVSIPYALAEDLNKAAESTIESFEKKFGVTPGKRRNHTKGFCFKAEFIPNDPAIKQYSISPIFARKTSVIGRLSHKGGNNLAPDNKPTEYGIGLKIVTGTGQNHLMALNTLDFFPVATPQAFAELMRAEVNGKEAVQTFKAKNKDLQNFKKHMAGKSEKLIPYEGSTYNSINSFYLVDTKGKKTAVRWSLVPTQTQKIELEPTENFFFENMQTNLKKHGVAWDMIITFANPEDVIENPALPWKGEHKTVVAATLNVLSLSSEKQGECDAINYDPLILSSGFAPSDDPMLKARQIAYSISFAKRSLEKAKE